MVKNTIAVSSAMLVLFGALLAGCGGSGGKTGGNESGGKGASVPGDKAATSVQPVNNEPVTITFGYRSGYFTEQEIQEYIIEPLKKTHPHITVKPLFIDNKTVTLPNLIAAKEVPDIITTNSLTLQDFKQMDLQFDMTELIKNQKIDLSKFKPDALDSLKITNQTDYLVGFPYTVQFNALYYNKDIFNKFGVAYPKDGMTWAEVAELAKKLTRVSDNVQYRGLEPDSVFRPASQLELPLIDPTTYKSIANTDQWKRVFQMVRDIYEIPGNSDIKSLGNGIKDFNQTQTIAMIAGLNWLSFMNDDKIKATFTNWDMASYPVFPEKPGIGTQIDIHLMLLSKTSKNKEAALQVMSQMFSEESQLAMVRNGKGAVLKDKKFEEEFGKNLDILKGKNVQAIFKTKPAKPFPPTEFASRALNDVTNLMGKIIKEQLDLNTALRQFDEEQTKKYAEARR
ncbi:ABC transporter substrate-binding protein [Paenibacillus ginsengarvi]|uniref:Extracellular solute-binding protein n=1 Tax=Paenibacillus ginsengarvi TaxID=400777 RepID=A0A3B0C8V7_9BACL|nr:extracellular solute-binding protein [Paenibacillus ginsengarvi]RKN80457.1 extracellular solute-binding protein [Paenibacillus ginsengarvi]